jgi:single-strand DNA-binding protein
VPNYSHVTVVGHLCRDPEVKYLPSGMAVCDLSLGVTDREKRNGEWVDAASFFDVVLFGKQAETAGQYLAKGSPCLIAGKLRQRRWEKDGVKRSKVEIVGDRMQLLGNKGDSVRRTADEYQPEPPADDNQDFDITDF